MKMPITKLFGISASGFNAGDDDIENYNAMIDSEIRTDAKGGLIKILNICSQNLFGFVPETLDFNFKPLRILNHKDEAELKDKVLNRITLAYDHGAFPSEKMVELINAEKIFPVDLSENESLSREELQDLRMPAPTATTTV
jgi:hypothetical protein